MAIQTIEAAQGESAWDERNSVRRLALVLVWLTVASGAVVFSEPAPVDVLSMGLIVGLPLVGLIAPTPMLWGALAVWLVCGAGAFVASAQSLQLDRSLTHSAISIYLYAMFFVMAAFVAKRPMANVRLILDAYLWAAFVGAVAGVVGYFNLLPGAADLFTRFGRAAGTFKDPNVYGAFLAPALIYALHRLLTCDARRTLLPGVMLAFLAFGVLLSFSRGAWFNSAVGAAIYLYFSVMFAASEAQRTKIIALGAVALTAVAACLAVASQIDEVGELLSQRAALTQDYDEGPHGRFGGQAKAKQLIVESPLGIGALEFGKWIHHEDVHNVYLSMFLNAGWIGGLVFAAMLLATIVLGLAHALKARQTRPLFLVAYAAFVATALEGFIVDIDHWRHFYLLMAMVWGVMAAERVPVAAAITRTLPRAARLVPLRGRIVAAT